MLKHVTVYIVSAFRNENSGGSPTGVVLDAGELNEQQMQYIATQLPVSHTAFAMEPAIAGGHVRVRFFTPHGEILNCGHGSIALHAARVAHNGPTTTNTFWQETKTGLQRVELIETPQGLEVYLQQNEIRFSEPTQLPALMDALSLEGTDLSEEFPPMLASPGSNRFLLCLRSAEAVNALRPDFDTLKYVCSATGNMGCFVYAIEQTQSSWLAVGRMFAPSIGVNEDIINGNSSGCLGAYLLQQSGQEQIALGVIQGHTLGCEGLVKVNARRTGKDVETSIGGLSKIDYQTVIELGKK